MMPRSWHVLRLASFLAWLAGVVLGATYAMERLLGWEVPILLVVLGLVFALIVIDLVERERALKRDKQRAERSGTE